MAPQADPEWRTAHRTLRRALGSARPGGFDASRARPSFWHTFAALWDDVRITLPRAPEGYGDDSLVSVRRHFEKTARSLESLIAGVTFALEGDCPQDLARRELDGSAHEPNSPGTLALAFRTTLGALKAWQFDLLSHHSRYSSLFHGSASVSPPQGLVQELAYHLRRVRRALESGRGTEGLEGGGPRDPIQWIDSVGAGLERVDVEAGRWVSTVRSAVRSRREGVHQAVRAAYGTLDEPRRLDFLQCVSEDPALLDSLLSILPTDKAHAAIRELFQNPRDAKRILHYAFAPRPGVAAVSVTAGWHRAGETRHPPVFGGEEFLERALDLAEMDPEILQVLLEGITASWSPSQVSWLRIWQRRVYGRGEIRWEAWRRRMAALAIRLPRYLGRTDPRRLLYYLSLTGAVLGRGESTIESEELKGLAGWMREQVRPLDIARMFEALTREVRYSEVSGRRGDGTPRRLGVELARECLAGSEVGSFGRIGGSPERWSASERLRVEGALTNFLYTLLLRTLLGGQARGASSPGDARAADLARLLRSSLDRAQGAPLSGGEVARLLATADRRFFPRTWEVLFESLSGLSVTDGDANALPSPCGSA